MIREHVDRRVLGALRLVDAVTGERVRDVLDVRAPGVTLVRSMGGDLVIRAVSDAVSRALSAHADAFATPPATPPIGDVDVEFAVGDPRRRYLPRRATVALPRDPDPAGFADPTSLFQPFVVRMYRSPAGAVAGGWAVVRAHVPGAGGAGVLAGALIRVLRESDDVVLGAGLADERGEALVAVGGIPVTTFDPGPVGPPGQPAGPPTGPVLITSVPVTLEVVHDPAAPWPPDPDDLEARSAALRVRTVSASLRSGEVQTLTI